MCAEAETSSAASAASFDMGCRSCRTALVGASAAVCCDQVPLHSRRPLLEAFLQVVEPRMLDVTVMLEASNDNAGGCTDQLSELAHR